MAGLCGGLLKQEAGYDLRGGKVSAAGFMHKSWQAKIALLALQFFVWKVDVVCIDSTDVRCSEHLCPAYACFADGSAGAQ